jgi:hypothetical protein
MSRTLKVKSVEGQMVQNYEVARAGLKRFVGHQFVAKEIDGVVRQGWERTEEIVSLPFRKEYLDALREGGLEPADEATKALVTPPSKDE